MIKGLSFSLAFGSNPVYTVQASALGMTTFADCAIENRGPGTVAVYPGGTPSGPALDLVGAYSRKYIMLGNIDTICMSLPTPLNGNLFGPYGSQLYAALAISDDYSLAGVPDYRRGRTVTVTPNSTFVGAGPVAATDVGFDKIRGIYIPPQPATPQGQVEIFLPNSPNLATSTPLNAAYPLISENGMTIQVSVDFISYTNFGQNVGPPISYAAFIISDDPIVAGGAGGGTYG
jgi:hypothetical protein